MSERTKVCNWCLGRGTAYELPTSRRIPCPPCNGTGQLPDPSKGKEADTAPADKPKFHCTLGDKCPGCGNHEQTCFCSTPEQIRKWNPLRLRKWNPDPTPVAAAVEDETTPDQSVTDPPETYSTGAQEAPTELEDLLDNYFEARVIEEDDQRTVAEGTLDMVRAQVAIEDYIRQQCTQSVFAARWDEVQRMPDGGDGHPSHRYIVKRLDQLLKQRGQG